MTRAELAAELNRSEITLFRWARKRLGPPVSMIGKNPMYRRKSMRRWLESLEQEAAAPAVCKAGDTCLKMQPPRSGKARGSERCQATSKTRER